jgi:hypothetical protein
MQSRRDYQTTQRKSNSLLCMRETYAFCSVCLYVKVELWILYKNKINGVRDTLEDDEESSNLVVPK